MKNDKNTEWITKHLPGILDGFRSCEGCAMVNSRKGANLPGQRAIVDALEDLVSLLFPGCYGHAPTGEETTPPFGHPSTGGELMERIVNLAERLANIIEHSKMYACRQDPCSKCGDCRVFAEKSTAALLESFPDIRTMLHEDILAAYEGDPAARSSMEIVLSYPGLYAVAVHRIAHRLAALEVPLVPRVMSEHAHARTGIDIHPGATIGAGFFIDHGTGVVIGETCVIGKKVKLYQGVTLGALSFAKDDQGNLVKGVKRHPDVEDNVVIYAGATILGGRTRIGHDSIIGGNVWLTRSVPPFSKVYNQQPDPIVISKQ